MRWHVLCCLCCFFCVESINRNVWVGAVNDFRLGLGIDTSESILGPLQVNACLDNCYLRIWKHVEVLHSLNFSVWTMQSLAVACWMAAMIRRWPALFWRFCLGATVYGEVACSCRAKRKANGIYMIEKKHQTSREREIDREKLYIHVVCRLLWQIHGTLQCHCTSIADPLWSAMDLPEFGRSLVNPW